MSRTHLKLSLFLVFLIICPATSSCDLGGFERLREKMVREQIEAKGIKDPRVVKAMRKVPRHEFVLYSFKNFAYGDFPLSIGEGQTISQPYIVAFMTEALNLKKTDKVLEIGTGSGYQAAILAELAKAVYTIEIIPKLGQKARDTLKDLGYENVHIKIGDGYKGWPERAPFDAIIVTCAPDKIPQALVDQLKEGGTMIIPVGKKGMIQKLYKVKKKDGEIQTRKEMDVRFVPMVKGEE